MTTLPDDLTADALAVPQRYLSALPHQVIDMALRCRRTAEVLTATLDVQPDVVRLVRDLLAAGIAAAEAAGEHPARAQVWHGQAAWLLGRRASETSRLAAPTVDDDDLAALLDSDAPGSP